MARRPATGDTTTGPAIHESTRSPVAIAPKMRDRDSNAFGRRAETRVQQIVELIDHCTLAKETSDRLGENFLSYLLAMTIQESRAALRRSNTSDPTTKLILKS